MIDETIFKNEEKAVFSLRALYRKYGYLPFKMSKFEPYELYMQNKDFLVSDRIITFNDGTGRLLALKPDVTLSIIKNGKDVTGCKQKVFYNETVYRASKHTQQFKEIMQTGLECIGDIDLYDIFEVISLAAESLSLISQRFVLHLSHLGILNGVLKGIGADETFREKAVAFIAEKNRHDLARLCAEYGIAAENCESLDALVQIYGDVPSVLTRLAPLCDRFGLGEPLAQLRTLYDLLQTTPYADKLFFDFSVVNDMHYYNGFIFRGFLDGIFEGVLTGGQYDNLMRRMHRRSGAVGFAIYLDLLKELGAVKRPYDVDVLVLYDAQTDPGVLAEKVRALTDAGKSVSAQKAVPEKLRFAACEDLQANA